MKPATIVAIVPMKPLSHAKTRLSDELSLKQRGALSLNLLRRVVKTIVQAAADPLRRTPIEEVWVVGGDDLVRDAAVSHGARWLEEEGSNLNEAMAMAFRWALESGRGALFLPADLPYLDTHDVQGIVGASSHLKNLVFSPADADGGTNGILIPPGLPHQFTPMMGLNSFSRHLSQAGSLDLPVAIYYSTGLGFDLDTSQDLQTYARMEPGLLATLTREWEPGNEGVAMATLEITCQICGHMLSTNPDASDANLRMAAIRMLEQQANNHTEHGLTGRWQITWTPE